MKKRGGVPYLKTNLKFSWESATDLDNNELNEILLKLGSHLNEVGLSYNVPSDSTSKPTRKRKLSPSDSEVSPLLNVVFLTLSFSERVWFCGTEQCVLWNVCRRCHMCSLRFIFTKSICSFFRPWSICAQVSHNHSFSLKYDFRVDSLNIIISPKGCATLQPERFHQISIFDLFDK